MDMLIQRTTDKLNFSTFKEAVEKERLNEMFVSGLLIRKDSASPTIADIASEMPGAIIAEVAEGIADSEILAKFREAFEKKVWLVIHLSDGSLPPLWREQLSRLHNSNSVFIQGKSVEETFFAEQPESTRVIVVVDSQAVEKVKYPAFLDLFGPVIEL